METKFFSLDEIAKNDGKEGHKTWIIVKDNVYDVTDYMDEHPGGKEVIEEWAGKNATKAFEDVGHSSEAKKELKQRKIGELREEDRQQNSKTNSKEVKTGNSRGFCSYVTCGLYN